MRAIDIDTLEWSQIKCEGLDEPMILIRKPHILELDIIEAEPVRHGRWMIHHYNEKTYEFEDIPYNPSTFDNPSGTLFCSVCDGEALLNANEEDVPSRFCPNCGAKMGAKEE